MKMLQSLKPQIPTLPVPQIHWSPNPPILIFPDPINPQSFNPQCQSPKPTDSISPLHPPAHPPMPPQPPTPYSQPVAVRPPSSSSSIVVVVVRVVLFFLGARGSYGVIRIEETKLVCVISRILTSFQTLFIVSCIMDNNI